MSTGKFTHWTRRGAFLKYGVSKKKAKQAFATLEAATEWAGWMSGGPMHFEAYKCRTCGQYHVGQWSLDD